MSEHNYEIFMETNAESPCCPLLSGQLCGSDKVIHQLHSAIRSENKEEIYKILTNVKNITMNRDCEVCRVIVFHLDIFF